MTEQQTEYVTAKKKARGFESPNYTQTPNDFFAMIPDMGESELRVTLVMIRQTFGFHRDDFKMGVKKLAKAAGLSRQGALDGANQAETRGIFLRTNPDAQGEATWALSVPLNQVDTPLQLVEASPQPDGGQVGVKERINKDSKKGDILDAILDQERNAVGRISYPKRESLPEPIRELIDVFVEITNIKPISKNMMQWLAAGNDWLEIGATPDDIREAWKYSQGKYAVLSPHSLTNAINAVHSGSLKPKNDDPPLPSYYKKFVPEDDSNKITREEWLRRKAEKESRK